MTTASSENEVSGGEALAEVGFTVGLLVGFTVDELLEHAVNSKTTDTANVEIIDLKFKT